MNTNKTSWANLKVGIVVLLGLAVFMFFVSIVGNDANVFTSTYPLKVFVPNVQGLVSGAMITLGGLKVGYVRTLDFTARDTTNGVDITFEVQSKYRGSITQNTVAQIKTIGLLGDKYIDLSIGSKNLPPLPDYAYVPLRESFDFEAAGPQLRTSLADFTELMKNLHVITGHIAKGEGSVGKLVTQPNVADGMEHFLQSLNNTMTAMEQKRGALGELIYDKPLGTDLKELAGNLNAVTGQIRQGKGTAGKLIMDDRLYNNLTQLSSRADSILARANADSSNVSKVIGDPQFFNNMQGVLHDLNLLMIDIRLHPERYIHFSVF